MFFDHNIMALSLHDTITANLLDSMRNKTWVQCSYRVNKSFPTTSIIHSFFSWLFHEPWRLLSLMVFPDILRSSISFIRNAIVIVVGFIQAKSSLNSGIYFWCSPNSRDNGFYWLMTCLMGVKIHKKKLLNEKRMSSVNIINDKTRGNPD